MPQHLLSFAFCLLWPWHAGAQPLRPPADRCVEAAARLHGVNHQVLRAVLMVESAMNPAALHRNANGTLDVGMAQVNSVHWPELARHGIAPAYLLDACISTYVAAWHLARQQAAFGNTWYAVGAYHSRTPAHNRRYQALVYRQLLKMGVGP